jgi:hypothetical protein
MAAIVRRASETEAVSSVSGPTSETMLSSGVTLGEALAASQFAAQRRVPSADAVYTGTVAIPRGSTTAVDPGVLDAAATLGATQRVEAAGAPATIIDRLATEFRTTGAWPDLADPSVLDRLLSGPSAAPSAGLLADPRAVWVIGGALVLVGVWLMTRRGGRR